MTFPPFFQRPKGALLRISILWMLYEKPMHGYELMKRIEEQTGGAWLPSHSLLYNTLGDLEEQGLVSSQKDYKGEVERTIYTVTDNGKVHFDEEVKRIARMFSQMMGAAAKQPFPQIPHIFLEHLDANERKTLLTQIQNRLKIALSEVEKELAKLKK
ncbi:MAG: PadR family transcriptional regulator [Promethearchaeota archaeon]